MGAGEGEVDLVNWAGYVMDGSKKGDPDWVTPFTKATGCKVNSKVAGTSDEMVTLMKTGQYDARLGLRGRDPAADLRRARSPP